MTELKRYGGLTYGTVRPQFVGQPVEDINKSRDILQQRSDVNKQALMDLEKTYGTLVNQIDSSEQGYLANFDKNLNADIQSKIANDEYEYIGPSLLKHAIKLTSDPGLQVRIKNKQEHDVAMNAIDKSDYSWEDKVAMKSLPEFSYKPVSTEEDATRTYKPITYRTPPKQTDIANEYLTAFRSLTPESISSSGNAFIKRGAMPNSNGSYSSKDLTRSFEESDGTGITYDTRTTHTEMAGERIKDFFKSLTNESVNPTIANFLKFKFELANRKPGESNEEFNARKDPEAYDRFVESTATDMAEQLKYKQNASEASIGNLSALSNLAKNSFVQPTVSSISSGTGVENIMKNVVESNKIVEQSKINTDTNIKEQQRNLGIPENQIKPLDNILNDFEIKGLGIRQQLGLDENDRTKAPAIANSIIQHQDAQRISNERKVAAFEYGVNKLKSTTTLTSEQEKELNDAINNLASQDKSTSDISELQADALADVSSVSSVGGVNLTPNLTKWASYVGLQAGKAIDKFFSSDIQTKLDKNINEWYENNSAATTDSHIISLPTIQGEKGDAVAKEIGERITPDFLKTADIQVKSGEKVIKAVINGTPTGDVKIIGYEPTPRGKNNQRHFDAKIQIKDGDGKLQEAEVLIPFNALSTTTTDAIMSDPRVQAADIVNSLVRNNLSKSTILPGVVLTYNENIGNTLIVGNRKFTNPDEIQNVLAHILELRKNELINGKAKTE